MNRNAIKLLSALELLPLEKCTSDAAEWRQEIADAIRDLRGGGLPADDPLRFDRYGRRLSKEKLDRKLKMIIDSWPKGRKRARKQNRSRNR